ncbi:MAG: hypothetical protein JWM64_1833 [Frankiales bacterium]|nr:hypothetical protein [Frankiales bacterium]
MTAGPAARALAGWALAYGVLHHLGLLPDGLGPLGGGTRVADLLDLAVPPLVLAPALLALHRCGTDRRGWVLAAVGALLYVEGHGVHLAANSIDNARGDAAPVHLWDEVVGHGLWYSGLALLVVALARAAAPVPLRTTPTACALALLVGATWTTNAVGADRLVVPAALVALALSGYGRRLLPTTSGRLLLVAFLPAALLLGGVAVAG